MIRHCPCDVIGTKPALLGGIKAAEPKDALTGMDALDRELIGIACHAPLAALLAALRKPT